MSMKQIISSLLDAHAEATSLVETDGVLVDKISNALIRAINILTKNVQPAIVLTDSQKTMCKTHKLKVIKELRDVYGLPLKEAVDIVNTYLSQGAQL